MDRRVVVSGVGAVTPLGNDAPSTWRALLAGKSGIGYVTCFDGSAFESAIAGEVKDFAPDAIIPRKDLRYLDRNVQLGAVAATEALKDAGLYDTRPLGPSCGVFFGSGAGGYILTEEQSVMFRERGPRRVSPFFLTNILPDAVSGYLAIMSGAQGPNLAVVAACATGAATIGEAAEVIRRGDADMMIAGGCEAPLTPLLYAGFAALRAIASFDDHPGTACKPFDARRDGFVVSEGAGAMVLESLEHALARGHTPYAEIIGYGSSNDAYDMVASAEDGHGSILAMEMALRKSGADRSGIGYVNAHGTGTLMNDRVETQALKQVFGRQAYEMAVSSTKSMTGHMMGAAGAVEAIITVLALRDQAIPPTTNYASPDPDCDLDYVPNEARRVQGLEVALSNSIGLGGHNAALVFRRLD